MKTAVITGASAGLGREFVRQLRVNFPEIGELWLIARRRGRLEELCREYSGQFSIHILPLDLCESASFDVLSSELASARPQVSLLINNAGCGFLGDIGSMDTAGQKRMTDLNVTALTAVTNIIVPYMSAGGHIINVSSIASFCPNPRMTVYSSTKAYVSSFSRGLGEELRPSGIHVTAVCPGPMDTEFLNLAGISGNSKMFDTLPHCDPVRVVSGTYKAALSGKAVYTPKLFFKFYRVISKVLPQRLLVKFAKT